MNRIAKYFNDNFGGTFNGSQEVALHPDDINIIALAKEEDRYIFLYHDHQCREICRTIRQFAGNPGLNLNWYDAETLVRKVRKE